MRLFGRSRAASQSDSFQQAVVRENTGMPEPPPAVRFDDVSLKRGGNEILHHVSFSVASGSICGLLAPSGGGKTTVLRLITGIYVPSSGHVLVLDKPPDCLELDERRRLGYMPQNFILYPELTVKGNLKFIAGIYGLPRHGRSRRIDYLMKMVDLEDARNRRASRLSGGMQRRLELAATLLHNPQVVVIDEPTAGIDPLLRARFWEYFRGLRSEGHTLIISTQYVTEAEYCDDVIVIRSGEVVAQGSPDELRAQAFGQGYLRPDGIPPGFEDVFLQLMQNAGEHQPAQPGTI